MALPGWAYGDPAGIVEANELRQMGCKACERSLFSGQACASGLRYPACKKNRRTGYRLLATCSGEGLRRGTSR